MSVRWGSALGVRDISMRLGAGRQGRGVELVPTPALEEELAGCHPIAVCHAGEEAAPRFHKVGCIRKGGAVGFRRFFQLT